MRLWCVYYGASRGLSLDYRRDNCYSHVIVNIDGSTALIRDIVVGSVKGMLARFPEVGRVDRTNEFRSAWFILVGNGAAREKIRVKSSEREGWGNERPESGVGYLRNHVG